MPVCPKLGVHQMFPSTSRVYACQRLHPVGPSDSDNCPRMQFHRPVDGHCSEAHRWQMVSSCGMEASVEKAPLWWVLHVSQHCSTLSNALPAGESMVDWPQGFLGPICALETVWVRQSGVLCLGHYLPWPRASLSFPSPILIQVRVSPSAFWMQSRRSLLWNREYLY